VRRPLILVIEDDQAIQELLSLILQGEGYEVISARDGLEGLVKLELQHPSLVIIDLMMPNISGDRVIEEVRNDPRLKSVPMLIVSGRHDVHDIFDPVLGAENVIAKPLDPAKLLARVEQILGHPELDDEA
jgi:DNA-binding response OmpR family regulator